MIFTYWTHPCELYPQSFNEWQMVYPPYKLFHDEDVLPFIYDEELAFYFNKINIPAAKSDVARLILLKEFGGLYLDAHTCPSILSDLVTTMDFASQYEMTLFGKKWELKHDNDFNFMNGVLLVRKNSILLTVLLNHIKNNLQIQYYAELEQTQHVPYNIHHVTGTQCFIDIFFHRFPFPPKLKDEYKSLIYIEMLDTVDSHGFHIHKNQSYKTAVNHWSERQSVEPLFIK